MFVFINWKQTIKFLSIYLHLFSSLATGTKNKIKIKPVGGGTARLWDRSWLSAEARRRRRRARTVLYLFLHRLSLVFFVCLFVFFLFVKPSRRREERWKMCIWPWKMTTFIRGTTTTTPRSTPRWATSSLAQTCCRRPDQLLWRWGTRS